MKKSSQPKAKPLDMLPDNESLIVTGVGVYQPPQGTKFVETIKEKIIYDPPRKIQSRIEYPTGFKYLEKPATAPNEKSRTKKSTKSYLTQEGLLKELGAYDNMASNNDMDNIFGDELISREQFFNEIQNVSLANRFNGTAQNKIELADQMVGSIDKKLAKIRYQREKIAQRDRAEEERARQIEEKKRQIEERKLQKSNRKNKTETQNVDDSLIVLSSHDTKHQELNHYFSGLEKPNLENIEALLKLNQLKRQELEMKLSGKQSEGYQHSMPRSYNSQNDSTLQYSETLGVNKTYSKNQTYHLHPHEIKTINFSPSHELQSSQYSNNYENYENPQYIEDVVNVQYRDNPRLNQPQINHYNSSNLQSSLANFDKSNERRKYKENFKNYLNRKLEKEDLNKSMEMLESKIGFDRYECTSPNPKRKKKRATVHSKDKRHRSSSPVNQHELLLSSQEEGEFRRQLIYQIIKKIDTDRTSSISLGDLAGMLPEMEDVFKMIDLDLPFLRNAIKNVVAKKGEFMAYWEFYDFIEKLIEEKKASQINIDMAKNFTNTSDAARQFILPAEVLETISEIFDETDVSQDLVLPREKIIKSLLSDTRLKRYLKKPCIKFTESGGSITLEKVFTIILEEATRKRENQESEHSYFYIDKKQLLSFFLNFQGRNINEDVDSSSKIINNELKSDELSACEVPEEILKIFHACFIEVSDTTGYCSTIQLLNKVRDEPLMNQFFRKLARRTTKDAILENVPETETYREVLDRIQTVAPNTLTIDEFLGFFTRRGYPLELEEDLIPNTGKRKVKINENLKTQSSNNSYKNKLAIFDRNVEATNNSSKKKGQKIRRYSLGNSCPSDNEENIENIESEVSHESNHQSREYSKHVHFSTQQEKDPRIYGSSNFGAANKISMDEANITIPDPFHFDSRDKEKKVSIRARRVEKMIEEIKRKDEEEYKKRPQAKPLPAHVKLNLYEKFNHDRMERSKKIKADAQAITIQNEKPFSFYYRDKGSSKKFKEDYTIKHEPFKANPVPWFCQEKGESLQDQQKQRENERNEKIQKRAQELYLASQLPPRMQKHEQEKKVHELQNDIQKKVLVYNPELVFKPNATKKKRPISADDLDTRDMRRWRPDNIDFQSRKYFREKEKQRLMETKQYGSKTENNKGHHNSTRISKKFAKEVIPKTTLSTIKLMEKRKEEMKEYKEKELKKRQEEELREARHDELKKVVKQSVTINNYDAQKKKIDFEREERVKQENKTKNKQNKYNGDEINKKIRERTLLVDSLSSKKKVELEKMKALYVMAKELKLQKVDIKKHFKQDELDLIDDYDYMIKNGIFKDQIQKNNHD